MQMKPTLKYDAKDYALRDLLVKYANGTPLACDQYNFLYRHEKSLSDSKFTGLKRYYLKDYYRHQAEEHSFLLPHEKLDASSIQALKKRIQMLLEDKNASLQFKMKPEQFLQLRAMTVDELILYHGNQFLTGAPFYQGGIPHTLYFQWGNLFGVAKYVVLAEEKALRSNVLIYIEDMQERFLDQCVKEYQHKFEYPFTPPALQMQPPAPVVPAYTSHFAIPTLSLSRNNEVQEGSG